MSDKATAANDGQSINDGLRGYAGGLSGLVNQRTGLGSSVDKARAGQWYFQPTDYYSLQSVYRSNWLARSIVDIPVNDMLREGWEFNEEGDECAFITQECERLGVEQEVRKSMTLARLFGWSGLYLSDGQTDVSEPLTDNGLVFIRALSCLDLTIDQINHDLHSFQYGKPKYYRVSSQTGAHMNIHPSRIIPFIGREIPYTLQNISTYSLGDSVLEIVLDSIENATSTEQGIAALIQEARVNVYKMDGFMNLLAAKGGEEAALSRAATVSMIRSIMNDIVLDAKDDYEQKQINFSGLDDIQRLFLEIVSGAADIPATRLLGKSPDGMNATGDSDMRNYYDSLSGAQEKDLKPALNRIFEAILAPKGKDLPQYEFLPLWQLSEQDRAEVNNKNAQTTQIYANTQLLDPNDLAEGVAARIAADGLYPGFEPTSVSELPEDAGGGGLDD